MFLFFAYGYSIPELFLAFTQYQGRRLNPLFLKKFCYTIPRMTPEEKKKLDEVYELVAENNELLKGISKVTTKMNRKMILDGVMKVVYYGVIIGGSIGAFYLVQPYIDSLRSSLDSINGTMSEVNKATGSLKNGVSVFSTMEENLRALTGGSK